MTRPLNLIPVNNAVLDREDVRSSTFLSDLCGSIMALYPEGGGVDPWIGYLVEEGESLVGTCAFKSPPDSSGVEIAYFTFPEHEGRGVATAMASELLRIARDAGEERITAQTLPEENASTRILRKLGFLQSGTAIDPDEGEVWVWVWQG